MSPRSNRATAGAHGTKLVRLHARRDHARHQPSPRRAPMTPDKSLRTRMRTAAAVALLLSGAAVRAASSQTGSSDTATRPPASAATPPEATRMEKDLLGEKQVPASAYYGVQTARALENFQISG